MLYVMDRIAIVCTEAQRLADVRSPTCPDWSAADLLWHLTEVHFFWAGVLQRDARTESDGGAAARAGHTRRGCGRSGPCDRCDVGMAVGRSRI